MKTAIGIIIFILIWYFLSILINSEYILPTPFRVFQEMINLFKTPQTFHALFSTAWKVFFSLFVVVLFGVIIGFILGLNDKVYEIFRPTILVIQSFPIISWLALVIFLWGQGWKSPILITILSIIPNTIFTTASGVQSVDRRLLEMAYVYKIPKLEVLKKIYLGSIIPFFIAALEVAIGNVWKVILVSEYLCGDSGIGVLIAWARQYVEIPQIYALTFIVVIIGIIFERILRKFTRRLMKRWCMY